MRGDGRGRRASPERVVADLDDAEAGGEQRAAALVLVPDLGGVDGGAGLVAVGAVECERLAALTREQVVLVHEEHVHGRGGDLVAVPVAAGPKCLFCFSRSNGAKPLRL